MATELAGFTPNEFRTYPIEEGGIIPLDLDETGQFYWNELVAKNVPLKDEPDKFESVNYLGYLSDEDQEHVEFAYRLVYAAHDKYSINEKDRFRKDKTTHTIFHLFDVCRIGAEYQLDAKTLQVLLLHDIYEDTLFDREFIAHLFGEDIASDIEGLTNIKRIEVDETGKKEDEAATALKKFTALAEGRYRVVLGKLIDRLTSMRTIQNLKEEPQKRNALETLRVYVPLAEKSGHPELADELAFLSHGVLEPHLASDAIVLKEQAETKQQTYKEGLETLLDYPVVSHDIRYTHCYQNLIAETADMPGIFQFSVIPTNPEYMMQIQKKLDAVFLYSDSCIKTPISDREISYKRGPVEITVMTPDMFQEKEVCIADTLRYGFDQRDQSGSTKAALNGKLKDVVKIINDYTEHQSLSASEALNAISGEIVNPRFMTALSKDGDPYVFPVGATVTDFAAKIHTDFARHGIGARINGSDTIFPLSTVLKQGDRVELIIPEQEQLPWTFTVEDYKNAKTEFAKNIMAHDFGRCITALVDYYQFNNPLADAPIFSSRHYVPEQLEEFAFGHYSDLVLHGYNKFTSHLENFIEIPYSISLSRLWCERMHRWHTRYPAYEVFCAYYAIGQCGRNVIETFEEQIRQYAASIEDPNFNIEDEVGGLESTIGFAGKQGRHIVNLKIDYPPDPSSIRRLNQARKTSATITLFAEPNQNPLTEQTPDSVCLN